MRRTTISTIFLLLFLAAFLSAKETGVTLDWMFSSEPGKIEATPSYVWLKDGTALLYDNRLAEEARSYEKLYPKTGRRERIVDPVKALANLRKISADDSLRSLSWPLQFDSIGKCALYDFNNDLYVMDVESAEFRRLTKSEGEEKAPTLSPDGKCAAFVRDHDLYTYDLTLGVEQRRTFDGSETLLNGEPSWVYWEEIFDHQDGAYWWSPDSRALAFLQSDQSMVSVMTFVDFQPTQPRVLTQYYPKAGQLNPVVKLGIVSLDDGKIVWARLPTDYEYIVQVVWIDARRLAVLTLDRAQLRLDLHVIDRATGEARLVLRETHKAWVEHYKPYFLKDGKQFIWTSERSGYAHLYLYNLDGRLANQITSGEWSVVPFGMYSAGESQVLSVDEKGWVYFLSNKESSIERQVYRCKLSGGTVNRVSREEGVHQPLFSPDGGYYLDRCSSADRLPSVALHRSDGVLVSEIAPARMALLDSLDLQFPQFFTILSADGFKLPAQIYKPKEFDPQKRYPLILYVYGGPSAPTVVNQWSRALYFNQLLLRQGYLVMSVDNRASAYIGKKIVESLNGRVMSDVEVNDLADAVSAIDALPYVDAGRIGIYGASGGGTYTLLAMTHTDLFKAGISRAPVTDWHFYDTKFTELIMKRPEDNPEGYEQTSLLAAAKNLHGRLLLIHGTYDDNVHIQNSYAFADELIKAGKVFDMMIYPMSKHAFKDDKARKHYYLLMLDFWKRNL
jgi:dipeptidyl-peptidase 4